MSTTDASKNPIADAFVVAVNDRGQHALWQASLDLPSGWRRESAAMSRRACLDAIAAVWRDIVPVGGRTTDTSGSTDSSRSTDTSGSTASSGSTDSSGSTAPEPHRHDALFAHERFAEQASRRPDAVAVIDAESALTYRELDRSANRLAHYLKDMGAGPETVIGVYAERSAEAICSLLAIMKAGCGYLPLDPSLPAARLARVCAEAAPAAVLAGRSGHKSLPAGTRVMAVGDLAADLERRPATAPEVGLDAEHLCYLIHTSGSTGTPKAVAVSYGSLACTIAELGREYQISARDRVVQLASFAFDTSIEQVLVALTRGATLILPPPGTIGPTDLVRYLERQRVTVIDLTPAYWHELLAITAPDDQRLRSVRLMITGGETADPSDCQAAMRAVPGARLLNAYGLTETTITSALFDLSTAFDPSTAFDLSTAPPASPVPVGKPIGHTRIMVLDEKLRPVPTGEAGEIYIGGCGVARGYLGRPALTAESFLPDASVPGGRMYRTGDLGRWRPDGNLEVIGRADRQLKVSGFRVDPVEIENVLAGHPGIGQVAVVASEQGPGGTRLAAYYTPRHPGQATSQSLRQYLRERLPGYMVPVAFVALDEMPLTPEGEPARDILKPLELPAQRRDREEELTPTQAGLSHLWSMLLKKDQVSLDDDFFTLGGNSLLAVEMLAHAHAMFGIGAEYVGPLTRRLLRDPTLRGFAQATRDARAGRLDASGDQPQIDFAQEADLRIPGRLEASPGSARPQRTEPLEILVTGSTGFLGAHLLRDLLDATTARVWCLVRARDAGHGMARIADAAVRYRLPGLPAGRVVPLPGDLGSPGLGLPPSVFRDLAQRIDVIYHAGASVNFIYPYEELRAANVTGTREVIRLASLTRGIPVHYVSTTAVLAGLGVMGVREVTEETPLAHADHLRIGYVQTKFVAEELIRKAGQAGLPVAIYRPLDIVGSLRTGVWNTASEMCALIKFITDTGLAPDIDVPLDFVPADICAAAIRHISSREGATARTYHLASPQRAPLGFLVDRLRARGFSISEIPYGTWIDEMLRNAARNPSHPMTAFVPLFIERDRESGLTPAEMYLEHVFPHYTRSNTEWALRDSDITFPAVDEAFLDSSIGHLIATGYLSMPSGSSVPAQRSLSPLPDQPSRAD